MKGSVRKWLIVISVNEGMVIFLMNTQTLVTNCPIRMSVRKGSLQFASLQHSEKKNRTLLLLHKTLYTIFIKRFSLGAGSLNWALPALDYSSAALASNTLPKQVSLAG